MWSRWKKLLIRGASTNFNVSFYVNADFGEKETSKFVLGPLYVQSSKHAKQLIVKRWELNEMGCAPVLPDQLMKWRNFMHDMRKNFWSANYTIGQGRKTQKRSSLYWLTIYAFTNSIPCYYEIGLILKHFTTRKLLLNFVVTLQLTQ